MRFVMSVYDTQMCEQNIFNSRLCVHVRYVYKSVMSEHILSVVLCVKVCNHRKCSGKHSQFTTKLLN